MSDPTDEAVLEALASAYALKDERRTGWQLRDVSDPETVAAHTWGVAMLVLRFAPEGIDRDRTLRMALVHDVAEAEVGDVPTRAEAGAETLSPAEKARLERDAIEGETLSALGDEVRTLWEEYEARDSPEARFLKDMDLLDTCLQALVYERNGRYDPDAENRHFEEYDRLDEFFATSEPRLSTDRGKELFEEVRKRYENAKDADGDR